MATNRGIAGSVVIDGVQYRATSCSVNASQTTEGLETIDGRWDNSAWRAGIISAAGDVSMPLPMSSSSDSLHNLIKLGYKRSNDGNLEQSFAVDVNYDYETKVTYLNCRANSVSGSMSVDAAADFTIGVVGTGKRGSGSTSTYSNSSLPTRVISWHDITLSSSGGVSIAGSQATNFSFQIENNVTAFHSMNGNLYATNTFAGKRQVSGSIEAAFTGFFSSSDPATWLATAPLTTTTNLTMALASNNNVVFKGVVYDVEDISLSTDFFTGSVAWKAYGDTGGVSVTY